MNEISIGAFNLRFGIIIWCEFQEIVNRNGQIKRN